MMNVRNVVVLQRFFRRRILLDISQVPPGDPKKSGPFAAPRYRANYAEFWRPISHRLLGRSGPALELALRRE
jgi:hypothetical protein